MLMSWRIPVAVALLCVSSVVSGCSLSEHSSSNSSVASDRQARAYVVRLLHNRYDAVKRIVPYQKLSEVLPNTEFKAPGRPVQVYSDVVVRGQIVDVSPGYGFVTQHQDDPSGTQADFDDPDAAWATVHLTLEVVEQLDSDSNPSTPGTPATLQVGYAVAPGVDVQTLEAGFRALGDVVLPLEKSPVFDYDPELYGIVADGGLLATLQDGRLSLPALEDSAEQVMLGNGETDTYSELVAEASEPVETIPAEVTGDSLVAAE